MKRIIFLFFMVVFLGTYQSCSSTKGRHPYIQREWMMVSFSSFTKDQLIKSKAGINLTMKESDGKIQGSAFMGCNSISFVSEFKNNGKVKISEIKSTMMVCQDMELETAFLKNFDGMTEYSIEGHFLILSDEKGHIMKFIAADWD